MSTNQPEESSVTENCNGCNDEETGNNCQDVDTYSSVQSTEDGLHATALERLIRLREQFDKLEGFVFSCSNSFKAQNNASVYTTMKYHCKLIGMELDALLIGLPMGLFSEANVALLSVDIERKIHGAIPDITESLGSHAF